MNIVYRVDVDNFGTLSPSEEFPELRFVSLEDVKNNTDILQSNPGFRKKYISMCEINI